MDPDLPFVVRDHREAYRLCASGLAWPVLSRAAHVLAGVHVADSPATRARAAAAALGVPGVLAFRTAGWVHAGGPEPAVLEHAARRRRPAGRYRRLSLRPADVAGIGGVTVTTPVRTAADLARDLPGHHAVPWLDRLGERAGLTPHEVLEQLGAMGNAHGVASARGVVRGWAVRGCSRACR